MANIRTAFIVLLTVFSLFTGSVCVAYSGGSGTQADPYRIADPNNWQQLMNTSTHWNKYFILTADINLTGVTVTPIAPDTSSSSGFQGTRFTGVFDGNGHIIRNVTINLPSSDHVGLFGFVDSNGQVKNLRTVDTNITGRNFVGGIAGYNLGNMTSCYATGTVSGTINYAGGLAGFNHGSMSSCYATTSVSGGAGAGGLVGFNNGNLLSCYATGTVTGTGDVGGLVGYNYYGSVTSCYATGDVTGTGDYVGGLVGGNDTGSNITSSYATGSVSGGNYVGGLAGFSWLSCNVTSCYSTGTVSGGSYIGGLVGENYGSVSASFWDMDTSGRNSSSGGTGLTTEQMMQQASFTGWDFTNVWRLCTDGTAYPALIWQFKNIGDFACPDKVNFEDIDYFSDYWLQTNCQATNNCNGTDFNFSGSVNFTDFAIFANHWLEGI